MRALLLSTTIAAFAAFAAFAQPALAHTDPDHDTRNAANEKHKDPLFHSGVYLYPLRLISATAAFGYEQSFSDIQSIYVEPFMRWDWETRDISSYGLRVQPHFYLKRSAPRGSYVSILAQFERTSAGQNEFAAGGTVGWSWILHRWNLKAGFGVQVDRVRQPSPKVNPIGDLKLGVVF